MLGYPRRDSAAIAIEEVRKFLESIDESNPIEKIVLVVSSYPITDSRNAKCRSSMTYTVQVYSSNDEFVYKSLIPIYFPVSSSSTKPDEPSSPPPRTILGSFGTLGDTFRKISSSKKQPVTPRKQLLGPNEEDVLINFEKHAQSCPTCSDMPAIYAEGKDLCDDGYQLAAQVLRHLNMRADQSVYSLKSEGAFQDEVDVPDIFPLSLELLRIVEESFRDPDRDRPFVSNQPALGKLRRPGYTVWKIQITVSTHSSRESQFSRIHVWSDPSNGWESFQASEPTLHLTRGSLVIREGDDESISKSPTRFYLNPQSNFSQPSVTEIFVDHINAEQLPADELGMARFTLRFESQIDCEMLLTRLKYAANNGHRYSESDWDESTKKHDFSNAEVTAFPQREVQKFSANVSVWAPSAQRLVDLAPYSAAASLSVTPGLLEIATSATASAWTNQIIRSRLRLTPLSIIRRHSDLEILVDNVITDDVLIADSKRYMLECSSSSDCDMLLLRLTQAIETGSNAAGASSVVNRAPSRSDSSDELGIREQLEALKQLWKTDAQESNEQSQIQSDAEMKSPSKRYPVDQPGVLTATMSPAGFGDHVGKPRGILQGSDPSSSTDSATRPPNDSSFPGFLEHRILTHMENIPLTRDHVADELELAAELDESRVNIAEAIEHLQALNLVTPVPERSHTWTLTKPQSPASQVARTGSYRDPVATSKDQGLREPDPEPKSSP